MEKKWSFMGSIQAFGASLGFGEAPEETPAVVKEGDIDRTYTIRGGGQGGYLGEALRDRKNVEKFVDQINTTQSLQAEEKDVVSLPAAERIAAGKVAAMIAAQQQGQQGGGSRSEAGEASGFRKDSRMFMQ